MMPAVRWWVLLALPAVFLDPPHVATRSQTASPAAPAGYSEIKSFTLAGPAVQVAGLVLTRDRVEMTFTGTFYFTKLALGRVTGAVFVGQGTVKAEPPPVDFEKENVRRLTGGDLVESDFKTAILRMTDETFDAITRDPHAAEASPVTPAAQKLAAEFEPRFLQETGVNLAARLALSIMNGETPGVFVAQFDGGRRGRFTFALDHQNRIPVMGFNVNSGEKGLIFAYQQPVYGHDLWMAFYTQQEYATGRGTYSDANDLVDVTHYQLDLDVHDVGGKIGVAARMDMQARVGSVRAVTFNIGESLSGFQESRLRNQLRLKSAKLGAAPIAAVQEDWEGGFTVFLPAALQAGDTPTLEVSFEGEFMRTDIIPECYYPRATTAWYPRHGYLDRATFDFTFKHAKRHKVAAVGTRLSEQPDESNKDLMVTKYRMDQPVALVVFAIGPFARHSQNVNFEAGGPAIPLEFSATQRSVLQVRENFIIEELDNSIRYFASIFGRYPYAGFGAALHPYNFGQGFPTLLMLPPADSGTKEAFQFISHETAHQWWGNIVAWRSYRDQWLSEGFAEYSGIRYTGLRDKPQSATELIWRAREALLKPPLTTTGLGKGRLADIGPIILGHRLNTSKTFGAYQALIYSKGALVLRMLHFLFSNPATGDDKAFLDMMRAFVERYRNSTASTDDFRVIANEHFSRTPIAQKYGLQTLDWFFLQWVRQSALPSYTLEYQLTPTTDGATVLSGTLRQENTPAEWMMPLPLVMSFAGNQEARVIVRVLGPSTTIELRLPAKPIKVELDPASWVLSEKTTTKSTNRESIIVNR
jgi:peptidase M1-like protein